MHLGLLVFVWPRLRSDVSDCVNQCPYCMLTYRWHRGGQELMFSWPVSSPFSILHVDLWMTGHHTNDNDYMSLMNDIYDMSQFVVVIPIPDESSAALTSYFMQYILMKFGLCQLVILDDDSPFKEDCIAMCEALNLNHNVRAKRNHKIFTVKHFHRFLNKSVTIAAEKRGTNDIFVSTGDAAGYAWNSANIDDTDIFRSISAIGRELHFPIDINLNVLPELTQNNGQAALDFF